MEGARRALAAGQGGGNTIRVGVLAERSGAKAYLKQQGNSVADKKIELMIKDTTGLAPDAAKRLAQELLVKQR